MQRDHISIGVFTVYFIHNTETIYASPPNHRMSFLCISCLILKRKEHKNIFSLFGSSVIKVALIVHKNMSYKYISLMISANVGNYLWQVLQLYSKISFAFANDVVSKNQNIFSSDSSRSPPTHSSHVLFNNFFFFDINHIYIRRSLGAIKNIDIKREFS